MKKENEETYINQKVTRILGYLGIDSADRSFAEIFMAICRYYEDLILNMPGNVYWLDANGLTAGCNKNVLRTFGLNSMDEFIGLSFEDQQRMTGWDDETTNSFKKDTFQVLTTGQAKEHVEEPPINGPDGQLVHFLTTRVPIFNQHKEVITVVGISTDITELKNTQINLMRAKEAAEAANHAKTEFVQNMQHDIRTPCAGLCGVLEVVAKTEPDAERRKILEMAVEASKRLLDLCNQAVEFGDLGGNIKPIVRKSVDIRELALSVIELNKPAAFAKELSIHFKIAVSVPSHIVSDEFRLSRILINLLGNAVKFSHHGEINLNITASAIDEDTRNGFLTIELKDQGIGIAADKIYTVFEKFSRGVPSNTNKYPGTGLGLYVVKTFVDELNGEIELESRENEGTYFKLNIPFKALLEELKKPGLEIDQYFNSPLRLKIAATKQTPATTIPKQPKAEKPFSHKLLIIEDDKTCLFAERNLLFTFTNDIDTAETVADALKKLFERRYDLVICDLGLPDGSGNDIVAKIKANTGFMNYNTPFVAMTAHQDILTHQRAIEAGFTATNTKPLSASKAAELLNAYPVKNEACFQEGSAICTRAHGLPVIDLTVGMERIAVHSVEPAIEGLCILMETLPEDIVHLQQAEKNNDIEMINAVLLKMRGALCYTGTPRLQAACEALFGKVGKSVQDIRKMQPLFAAFYDEAKLFSEQFKELINSTTVNS